MGQKPNKQKQSKKKPKGREIALVLCGIRSAHNVGSIFRTADAAGVSFVYLSGVSPLPVDRFGRERSDIAKAALGAQKNIKWAYFKSASAAVEHLKSKGFYILALEQSKKSKKFNEPLSQKKAAVVLGNEVSGIPKSVLRRADRVTEIPMRGKKESLNVSVAAGIMLYELIRS